MNMSVKRRNQSSFVVQYFIDNFVKKHSWIIIPNDIYHIIFDYYYIRLWKWDTKTNNKTNKFIISDDLTKATSQVSCFNNNYDYATIFLDDTIINDGYYCFKFKFYGTTRTSNEIAIGVININTFDFNCTGIGDDNSGSWSWYQGGQSEIFMNGLKRIMIPFKLYDQNIYALKVNVKNKKCNYTICCNDNKQDINITGMVKDLPIKIGVSMNTKYSPLSLQILEQ